MTACSVCKAEGVAEKKIRTSLEYQGRVYIFDNVSAEVCGQCGEVLLRPEVAKRLEALMRRGTAPERTETVPVYDLDRVA